MLERNLINQLNTTTALVLMQEELEKAKEDRLSRARKCGCADDCLECFQLAWCVRNKAEKKALTLAQWGYLSKWDKED